MFCVRCGRENREDAGFCLQCGAHLVRIPDAQAIEKPSRARGPLWILGIAVSMVALAVVISMAVYAWSLYQSHQPDHVVVDGKTVVGADGEPIELIQNSDSVNVTWTELKQFLLSDQTDRIPYNENTFVCADYAERLHNNAEEAGIEAAYVVIHFATGTGHAINAFKTTDKGLIYVDDTGTTDRTQCSADKTVDVEIGRSYIPESIFPCPSYSVTWENLGTVTDFSVIW